MDSREIVEDPYEDMDYDDGYCEGCMADSCDDCMFLHIDEDEEL